MSDVSERESPLAKSLQLMFPECEVQVVSKKDVRTTGITEILIPKYEHSKNDKKITKVGVSALVTARDKIDRRIGAKLVQSAE